MAEPTLDSNTVLCTVPFKIRRLNFGTTGGTDVTTITHGETSSPTFCIAVQRDISTPGNHIGIERDTSATTMKIDCSAAEIFDVYCFWLDQASGGLNPPA